MAFLFHRETLKAFAVEIKNLFLNEELLKKLRQESLQFVRRNYGAEEHFDLLFENVSKSFRNQPPSPIRIETFHKKLIDKVLKSLKNKTKRLVFWERECWEEN